MLNQNSGVSIYIARMVKELCTSRSPSQRSYVAFERGCASFQLIIVNVSHVEALGCFVILTHFKRGSELKEINGTKADADLCFQFWIESAKDHLLNFPQSDNHLNALTAAGVSLSETTN